jgi:hypothetical protein
LEPLELPKLYFCKVWSPWSFKNVAFIRFGAPGASTSFTFVRFGAFGNQKALLLYGLEPLEIKKLYFPKFEEKTHPQGKCLRTIRKEDYFP